MQMPQRTTMPMQSLPILRFPQGSLDKIYTQTGHLSKYKNICQNKIFHHTSSLWLRWYCAYWSQFQWGSSSSVKSTSHLGMGTYLVVSYIHFLLVYEDVSQHSLNAHWQWNPEKIENSQTQIGENETRNWDSVQHEGDILPACTHWLCKKERQPKKSRMV